MQLAGSNCSVCGRSIVFAGEGKFCSQCGITMHSACDSGTTCKICGQAFRSSEALGTSAQAPARPRWTSRLVVPTLVGLGAGLVSLLQASGVVAWLPERLFEILNYPAVLLASIFISGERALLLVPLTIPAQWLLVGLISGIVLNEIFSWKQRS